MSAVLPSTEDLREIDEASFLFPFIFCCQGSMSDRKALRLRELHAPSSNTNSTSQRMKNRKQIDEALQEAEVLRCKTAQLGRIWKHNSELLRQERLDRQKAEQDVLQRQAMVDSQVKDIHELAVAMHRDVNHLNDEGIRLEGNVERYQDFCQTKFREVELLQLRLDELEHVKEVTLRSSENIVSEMRLKVEKLEVMTAHVDDEITEAEKEKKMLNLELRLGGV
jgi:hypothetical protein